MAVVMMAAYGAMVAEPVVMTWRWLFMDMPFTPYLGEGKQSPWFLFGISIGIHGIFLILFVWAHLVQLYDLGVEEGTFRHVVRERYRGWKGKYCPKVDLVD